jgi:hypothetical protein
METFITPFSALNEFGESIRLSLAHGLLLRPSLRSAIRFGDYLLQLTNNQAVLFVLGKMVNADRSYTTREYCS